MFESPEQQTAADIFEELGPWAGETTQEILHVLAEARRAGRAGSEEKRMAKERPAKDVDEDATGFELTAQQEAELAESIAEADRGDVITAAEILERLRR
jgi:hypothetical protein